MHVYLKLTSCKSMSDALVCV